MALNKNHEFEELNGIKCGIVEKNVSPERAEFLKKILEFNRFEVVIVPSPPPKVEAPKPVVQPGVGSLESGVSSPQSTQSLSQPIPEPQPESPPPPPATFTVGVTDTTFNPINAIFGRQLKTPEGNFITLAYWNQKESVSNDEIPYYEQKL
jgi:hypothetical protein